MYEENPYAAPESVRGQLPYDTTATTLSSEYYVDGGLIMCGMQVALPEICVITGETEDLIQIRKTITWAPKWIYLLILINLLVLLIVYLVVRKQCGASYYLSRQLRNRKRWMAFYGFICLGAALICLIVGANSDRPEIYFPLGLIAFITALVLFVFAQPVITAVRHEKGRKFWLKGFKPAFFDQLRVMYSKPG